MKNDKIINFGKWKLEKGLLNFKSIAGPNQEEFDEWVKSRCFAFENTSLEELRQEYRELTGEDPIAYERECLDFIKNLEEKYT